MIDDKIKLVVSLSSKNNLQPIITDGFVFNLETINYLKEIYPTLDKNKFYKLIESSNEKKRKDI